MVVSVFGLGYVGCVSAACLARDGHTVVGVDVNPVKVEQVNGGHSPVVEPGLQDLIAEAVAAGRLRASLDPAEATRASEVSLICVGTPSQGNGNLNCGHVEHVAKEIGEALRDTPGRHVVVVRSTVLPGTLEERVVPGLEERSGRRLGVDLGVCMNPEFLREGSAIADYDRPSFVLIGESDGASGDDVARLYAAIDAPVLRTTIRTAEMVKYVGNAFHALKVAFANEIGALCKAHGIDGQEVMDLFCRDDVLNISRSYLKPGFAFGGSCLPKDVRALVYRAKQRDVETPLLNAVLESNARHLRRGVELVEATGRKRAGVLGLSFKPGTDDVRESPTVALIETLVGRGYHVSIYDEHVDPSRLIGENKASLERELPHIAALMRSSIDEVVNEAEVVVVANGSAAFRRVPSLLRPGQVLVDLVGVARGDGQAGADYDGICW